VKYLRKVTYFILVFFICSNCSEEKTEWKTEREVSIHFGGKPKDEKFNLSFKKKEDLLTYNYVSQIDTTKNINITIRKDLDSLFFNFDKFLIFDKEPFHNEKLNDFEFNYSIQEDSMTDGTGPILFNVEYGLLAINNVFGPTLIFLEKKDDDLIKLILSELND